MYAGYLLGLILSLFFPQITLTVTQAPNKDCALAGSVINGATGAGVKKATVVARNVQGIGTYQTTTDSSGGFAFSGVAPGQYNLYAEHVDFLGSPERTGRSRQRGDRRPRPIPNFWFAAGEIFSGGHAPQLFAQPRGDGRRDVRCLYD
ncbi:MAG: hypothetical protein DMG22_12395 [Acidobacteria bacterium]|nr:MAG: hypothetical protein DMG22_12395 [Acidobacteriota bacterium]